MLAPAAGTPSASASPRAVASPMRTPVKLPGPTPPTTPSISDVEIPARSTSSWQSTSTSWATWAPRLSPSASTTPSRHRQAVAAVVAVSTASNSTDRSLIPLDLDLAGVRARDAQEHPHVGSRQPRAAARPTR